MTTQTIQPLPLPPPLPAQGPLPLPPLLPLPRPAASLRASAPAMKDDPLAIGLLPAMTFAIWITCMAVGIGLLLKYPMPKAMIEPVVDAKLIHVDLSNDPVPGEEGGTPTPDAAIPPAPLDQPPPPVAPPEPEAAPPLASVAEPSPAIAFPVAVEGPAQKSDAQHAAPAAANANANAAPAVRHLAYGKGEGAQPAPEYPPEAIRANQQGTVTVRFTVGSNGRVTSADVSNPSPYPMLNQAALRVIRSRWQFAPGGERVYEIVIHFQLN